MLNIHAVLLGETAAAAAHLHLFQIGIFAKGKIEIKRVPKGRAFSHFSLEKKR